MSKGKYAERARSKQDADARLRAAVVESNRLRDQIHELRSLRSENANLRSVNAELRRQLSADTSNQVQELETALRESVDSMDKVVGYVEAYKDKLFERVSTSMFELLDAWPTTRFSETWWSVAVKTAMPFVNIDLHTIPDDIDPKATDQLRRRMFRAQVMNARGGGSGAWSKRNRRSSIPPCPLCGTEVQI